MNWVVTGATGQLGIAMCKELGYRGLNYNFFNSRDLDISNRGSVFKIISEISPSVIVNCAGWTDVDGAEANQDLAFQVNSFGPENLALAAVRTGAKFIHISSDYVFSGERQVPYEIGDETSPQSAYGRSKAEGESRVLAANPEQSFIVRTSWLYSPWRKNFAKTMARLAFRNEESVRVVNDQVGQPTSAIDLAKQIVNLGLSDLKSGIYHGTNSGQATWYEFAKEIFLLAGSDANRVEAVTSKEFPQIAKRPSYSVLSHRQWSDTSISALGDWREALKVALPEIIRIVKEEA